MSEGGDQSKKFAAMSVHTFFFYSYTVSEYIIVYRTRNAQKSQNRGGKKKKKKGYGERA